MKRYFMKERKLAKRKHLTIGFHCTASVDGSPVKSAKNVIETVKNWADSKRVKDRIDRIVLVDIYGEYSRVLNSKE